MIDAIDATKSQVLHLTSDDRVSRVLFLLHVKVPAGVLHELVVLQESAGVAQELDALTGRQFTLESKDAEQGLHHSLKALHLHPLVLAVDPLDPAAQPGPVGGLPDAVADPDSERNLGRRSRGAFQPKLELGECSLSTQSAYKVRRTSLL